MPVPSSVWAGPSCLQRHLWLAADGVWCLATVVGFGKKKGPNSQ